MTLTDMLADAAAAGVVLSWNAGKLRIQAPPAAAPLARAIRQAERDFTGCPACSAVTPADLDYCGSCGLPLQPTRTPPMAEQRAEIVTPPVVVLTPPVRDGPMFADSDPELALVPMRCGTCFRQQDREWGSVAECVSPGCGNRTSWITACGSCGRDAAPGLALCMACHG